MERGRRPVLVHKFDLDPPAPVTDVAAVAHYHRITVTWTNPADVDLDAVEIWHALWHDGNGNSVYPDYDDVPNQIPTRPASRAAALASEEWVLAGTVDASTETYEDLIEAPLGDHFYELFASDDGGTLQLSSGQHLSDHRLSSGRLPVDQEDPESIDGDVDLVDFVRLPVVTTTARANQTTIRSATWAHCMPMESATKSR